MTVTFCEYACCEYFSEFCKALIGYDGKETLYKSGVDKKLPGNSS